MFVSDGNRSFSVMNPRAYPQPERQQPILSSLPTPTYLLQSANIPSAAIEGRRAAEFRDIAPESATPSSGRDKSFTQHSPFPASRKMRTTIWSDQALLRFQIQHWWYFMVNSPFPPQIPKNHHTLTTLSLLLPPPPLVPIPFKHPLSYPPKKNPPHSIYSKR